MSNKKKTALEIEMEKVQAGKTLPYGWPKEVTFDKEALASNTLNVVNMTILTRAILGHFTSRNKYKKMTKKDLVELALEEYMKNHSDDLL